MKGKFIVIVCFLLLAGLLINRACRTENKDDIVTAEKVKASEVPKDIGYGKLRIYMYGGVSVEKARVLEQELKKYFPDVEVMQERLELPKVAYVKPRNRYRGTGLLDDLRSRRAGGVVLGLTDRIICMKNEISPDFGIMGISYMNSGLAVASTVVPKTGKMQTDANLIKLALHELGHAYGLPHCPDQKCYMVDAEHRMKFPHTTGFCANCRSRLQSKGMKL